MSEAEDGSTERQEETSPGGEVKSAKARVSLQAAISWRRIMIAVLVASALFLLLFNLGSALAVLVWLGCIVFLPVAVWLGRESRRPWLDGAVYGFVTALVVAVILSTSGFAMGTSGAVFSLFLILPQALFGAWLGARFPSPRIDDTR